MRAIRSGPVAITFAFGSLKIVNPVIGTARQALVHLLVHDVALVPFPAGLAIALTADTGPVICAGGVFAVSLAARLPFPARLALAAAPDALTVAGTVCDTTVRFGNVAFWTFPAFFAVAQTAAILAVGRAQHRAHTCNNSYY